MPGAEDIEHGFEGGRIFKINDMLYCFMTEMCGGKGLPKFVKTRTACWKSKDGFDWVRVTTVYESTGNFDAWDKNNFGNIGLITLQLEEQVS